MENTQIWRKRPQAEVEPLAWVYFKLAYSPWRWGTTPFLHIWFFWLSTIWFGFVKKWEVYQRVIFPLTVSVNFVNMLNMWKWKWTRRTVWQRSIWNPALCFTSGEFFVMKSMSMRWSEPYRKEQLQAAMLSLTTIIKRGFGSSPAAKFLC